ncbi:hypothetical protein GOODEAATRI_029442 [Goodea atripinnis]|uniref:Uncharacterized protein n=1 Tax=Goodea atripinnis TaxID=208336 RepID=A0ABV0MLS6_9TELE
MSRYLCCQNQNFLTLRLIRIEPKDSPSVMIRVFPPLCLDMTNPVGPVRFDLGRLSAAPLGNRSLMDHVIDPPVP